MDWRGRSAHLGRLELNAAGEFFASTCIASPALTKDHVGAGITECKAYERLFRQYKVANARHLRVLCLWSSKKGFFG